jgi:hypothetical protein
VFGEKGCRVLMTPRGKCRRVTIFVSDGLTEAAAATVGASATTEGRRDDVGGAVAVLRFAVFRGANRGRTHSALFIYRLPLPREVIEIR